MSNKVDYQHKLLVHHFGDVPSGWRVVSLKDVFAERVEPNADLSKYPLYSFTIEKGVTPKTERYERSFLLKAGEENEYKLVHPNDFVINPMNLRFGAIGYSKVEKAVSVSAYYDILRVKNSSVDIDFLEEFLSSRAMLNIYNRVATGSLIEKQRVHYSEFKDLKIFFPPENEQRRIGNIIRCWNARIKNSEKTIAAKVKLRKGLMQQLLTGEKRFPEFAGKEWRKHRIGELLKEVDRYCEWNDEELYRLASVRRRSGGLFLRESLYGKQIKTKVLKTIHTGDFLISKMQVVHGAMALTTPSFDGVSVSDSYIALVSRDETKLDINFFNYLSQMPEMYRLAFLSSYGVHIEKMTFNLEYFLREKISIPPTMSEQHRIIEVLNACDKEIELLVKQHDALKEQKRGLMRQLLRGQKRVKVDEQAEREAVAI